MLNIKYIRDYKFFSCINLNESMRIDKLNKNAVL